MINRYKIMFEPYIKIYHECEEYSLNEYITDFGGLPMWKTIYKSKNKKDCEKELKRILLVKKGE